MISITERQEQGATIFLLEGRIDTEGAVNLDAMLRKAAAEGKHKMVLDMHDVRYISSAGLRTLADLLSRNREHGGDLKLVALSERVLRVFQIIGFERFFTFYETVPAAVADFSK